MTNECDIEKRESEVVQAERTRGGRVYRPNVDIIEKGAELLLLADLPGAEPDSIDVDFENGVLSVSARVDPRQDERDTNYLLREYGVGDYNRNFQVGEGIDASRIAAEFADGVLTLHLPKAEAVLPKKIAVKTG
jgi:HSP20 family protein